MTFAGTGHVGFFNNSSGNLTGENAISFFNGGSGINQLVAPSHGIAASQYSGSFSLWVQWAADATDFDFMGNAPIHLNRDNTNALSVIFSDDSSNNIVTRSAAGITGAGVWHNILCSWNLNHTAGNKVVQLYVDGAAVGTNSGDSGGADKVGWLNFSTISIGAVAHNQNHYMAEFWLNASTFIDFSVAANRAAFRTNTGHPVFLGVHGQIPTGTSPDIYLNGNAATITTNQGTCGNMDSRDKLISYFLDRRVNRDRCIFWVHGKTANH